MKHRILPALALASAVGLAACATGSTPPINALASIEQALIVADQGVLVYEGLQPCGPTSTPICRSPEVEAQVKMKAAAAYAALEAARPVILANPNGGTAEQDAMTAVSAALAAYQAVVGTLPSASK